MGTSLSNLTLCVCVLVNMSESWQFDNMIMILCLLLHRALGVALIVLLQPHAVECNCDLITSAPVQRLCRLCATNTSNVLFSILIVLRIFRSKFFAVDCHQWFFSLAFLCSRSLAVAVVMDVLWAHHLGSFPRT